MPQDKWLVVIPDHHPGYITWDQFPANRKRLAANRTNDEVLAGPAREGLCLLQGLLLCGHCGRRLNVRYSGNGGLYPVYLKITLVGTTALFGPKRPPRHRKINGLRKQKSCDRGRIGEVGLA
jgi:hypothetical protein